MNGTQYAAFSRKDGWLRFYHYAARFSLVMIVRGITGFFLNDALLWLL